MQLDERETVRRGETPSRLSMAFHRNKVLDGGAQGGHYHRRLSFVSQEVRFALRPQSPTEEAVLAR